MKKNFFLTVIALVGLLTIVTGQSLPSYLPSTGLVGWWPFNGNANDESGNGNNGTVHGAINTTDRNGINNSAYYLNGNSNIVINNSFFDNGWTSYTINCWVNVNVVNHTNTFLNTNPHCGVGIGYSYLGTNRFYHFKGGDAINNSVGCWSIFIKDDFNYSQSIVNQWKMITITKLNNTYTYYVDGQVDKISTSNNSPLNGLCSIYLGSINNGAEFMNGKLDDIGIWNRALTQTEITALYNAATGNNTGTTGISTPQLMSYQAVVRNGSNQLLSNAPAGVRVSILQGSASGTAVYSETHTVTTNAQGLANLSIGGGTAQSGTFAGINWGTGPYFLKTETDPTGGTNYSITATSQLMSVPYALYAEKAGNNTPGPSGPPGAIGPQGTPGMNGTNGTDGKTLLSGTENPADSIGKKGDFYINTTSNTIFGPKASGNWPISGVSMVGPTGPTGNGFNNGTVKNQIMYWNGSMWVTLNPGTHNQTLQICNETLTWTTDGQCFHRVGKLFQGGVIGYLFKPGDPGYIPGEAHGLIVALNDVANCCISWGCNNILIGGTSSTLGSGLTNTNLIVGSCGQNGAAKLCYDYVSNGYSDWFLPSSDELTFILNNINVINPVLSANGGTNVNQNAQYWSSTESTNGDAFMGQSGYLYTAPKSFAVHVRAIRAF